MKNKDVRLFNEILSFSLEEIIYPEDSYFNGYDYTSYSLLINKECEYYCIYSIHLDCNDKWDMHREVWSEEDYIMMLAKFLIEQYKTGRKISGVIYYQDNIIERLKDLYFEDEKIEVENLLIFREIIKDLLKKKGEPYII